MLIFIYSAAAKVFDFSKFSSEISKSPFLHNISTFLSFAVPIVEGAIGIMLLVKRTRIQAIYAYLYVIASFTLYVFLMKKRAYNLPCACMGLFDTELGWDGHFVLNIVITIFTFIALFLERNSENLTFLRNRKLFGWS